VTILFPDVSQYNSVLPAGDVVIARACIGNVRDARYAAFRAAAAVRGAAFTAYAFLNSPALGVTAQGQAEFAFSVIGASIPTMIDLEPNRGYCASLADALTFADRFRALGGVCHLCYLPKWAWRGWMGSPDLNALTQAGIWLVSSNYTAYADNGPGWQPYAAGQPAPVQWQFTDNFAGSGADGNAHRGTVDQYLSLIGGDLMASASDIITAWAEGVDHTADGTQVSPVIWQERLEKRQQAEDAWRAAVTAGLADLHAAVATLKAALAAGPSAADVAAELIKQLRGA
jgi:hypothetical protein